MQVGTFVSELHHLEENFAGQVKLTINFVFMLTF